MKLNTSRVHRRLDAKLQIVGLEAHDLLFVLLFASIMNLIFGSTFLALYLVFILPLIMAATLYLVKRNKPPHFLIHFFKYKLTPGLYSCGNEGKFEIQRRRRIDEQIKTKHTQDSEVSHEAN